MPLTDTAIRNAKPGAKPAKLFDERGLFAANVSPRTDENFHVKRLARTQNVFAAQPGLLGEFDLGFHRFDLLFVFVADVDVTALRLQKQAG